MKFLSACSYICGMAGIITGLLTVYFSIQENEPFGTHIVVVLVTILPGVTQIFHTARANNIYYYPKYKASNSLDDHLLNDIDSSEYIVSTGNWQKIFIVVNSLLLSILAIAMTYAIRLAIKNIVQIQFDEPEEYIVLTLFIIYVFAVPTILYNLRTFNLKRIKI